ncbi:TolC family protein [Lutibacter sp. B1]|uniref:TolC family protein n=1 Tax=Lutibacter sp. B1 TaxID=2725996 RepID=UPI001456AA20|nr:TolC family protein [Lutibacter sp. B1]NLP56883.1 TolC family protein [Lutibacter sp. B1]
MDKFLKKLIVLFLFITTVAYGQESWSLNECITYALEHNLKLNDLNYTIKSNQEKYKQSYRELLPNISANSSYSILYGRSVDPNTNEIVSSDFFSNNYSIDASISIFKGFQKLNSIASAKFLYKAVKEERLQEKYLLAFSIMTAFYDVKFYEEQLQIALEQLHISSLNLNLVKKQIELGLKAGSDLYEAESVLTNDELSVIQSKNNLNAALLKLKQEMNLNAIEDIKINTLDETTFLNESDFNTINSDSVYQKALTFIPSIKAQEFKTDAAKKDISIAKSNLYPSLSFSAGYGTGYYETNINEIGKVIPFNTQIKDNASQYIGFYLTIPISERWSNRSQIKQQKIALLQAKNNLNIQKQELHQLIQELVQNYEASKMEYNQTKKSEESHQLSFKIAQKKYDKGMISLLELYQAKNLYANSQNKNLQAKLKMKVQKKTLDFYNGLPVFNINNAN